MKLSHIVYATAFIAGLAYGCNHQKEVRETFTDVKSYTIDSAREITESPSNLEAVTDAAHDIRYMHGGRAARTLSRIDLSRNSEPLQDHRQSAYLKRDLHNLTKDLDQDLEEADLYVEKIWHSIEELF
jgi:hypothetical protein